MSTGAHLFLIAYDISCPRRWRRVQRILKGLCRRNQLSVYLCRATPARIRRLESQLRHVMHHRDDRLMILDLGHARVGNRLREINPMSDIEALEAAIV